MIPPVYPCGTTRYVEKMIKIREWVKNEISALNLLCNVVFLCVGFLLKNKYKYPGHVSNFPS